MGGIAHCCAPAGYAQLWRLLTMAKLCWHIHTCLPKKRLHAITTWKTGWALIVMCVLALYYIYQSHMPPEKDVFTIRFFFSGGIGNELFWYASGLAIASRNHMAFHLEKDLKIRKFFNLTEAVFVDGPEYGSRFAQVKERQCCCYNPSLARPRESPVRYEAYLQSWKYFVDYRQVVREQFRPNADLLRRARRVLDDALATLDGGDPAVGGHRTLVGVHVRRGDMLHQENMSLGFQVADARYLRAAIAYFARRHRGCTFVVCSDDMAWTRRQLEGAANVVFVSAGSAILDFIVLTLTNHTVMTTGTFSWWVAYLTGGDAVYYNQSSRPGSELAHQVCTREYYLPNWVPL
ncbi:PREDICTED: galactoside 2-alpha-L-fucosyltransferase 1-like [Priapulus caudatus]|uniref:L-Fucosyltransferase n=1 Tax=Priapulus caudatus TaxID=37621 RepID=A0ABM1EHL4_PRICU|nr:PREDICTED: galactoside 2-alpha-L-fucosyltransferase 1-like [Priapulus caudatus]